MSDALHIAAWAPTLKPGVYWRDFLHEGNRLTYVRDMLAGAVPNGLQIIEAKPSGEIIVRLTQPLSPGQRGTKLLDLEEVLKRRVDPALTVWLEPMGDRNTLRHLRGVEVK